MFQIFKYPLSIFNCVTLERELLLGLEFNPDRNSNVGVLFFWISFAVTLPKLREGQIKDLLLFREPQPGNYQWVAVVTSSNTKEVVGSSGFWLQNWAVVDSSGCYQRSATVAWGEKLQPSCRNKSLSEDHNQVRFVKDHTFDYTKVPAYQYMYDLICCQ